MTGKKVLLRNTFLMFCGLFFYCKTSGFFVFVLIFAILLNYLCARLVGASNNTARRKAYLVAGLTVNLKGRRELDCDTDGWSRYESRT